MVSRVASRYQSSMPSVLFILSGPTPPAIETHKNKYFHLSQRMCGDILQPVWGKRRDDEKAQRIVRDVRKAIGRFHYNVTFSTDLPSVIRVIWEFFFYIFKGMSLHRAGQRYEAIIAYGTTKTGLAACILKKLLRTRLIVEVPGNTVRAQVTAMGQSSLMRFFKSTAVRAISSFVIRNADHIHLLYPEQIDYRQCRNGTPVSVFHDFVPVHSIPEGQEHPDNYILFIGYPWFLKGVDLLIKAFNILSPEFPDLRLKLVGFCPPREQGYFSGLANGNQNIDFCNALPHDMAMKLMARCRLFVLPSRTEGMGRVLLEAMAARKPIVASSVDGIPYYVHNGENGLLFERENVNELADKMRAILSDDSLARRLADNAYRYVHQNLSEYHYLRHFGQMVENVSIRTFVS